MKSKCLEKERNSVQSFCSFYRALKHVYKDNYTATCFKNKDPIKFIHTIHEKNTHKLAKFDCY